jgi:AraC-like DNA-binding protein
MKNFTHSGNFAYSKIVERLLELVDASPDQSLSLAKICKMIGTSARTLRDHCCKYLGMSAARYMRRRRMQLAHDALLSEKKEIASTVTRVAVKFGFTDLGRFSVEYRKMFGESPSVTLHSRGIVPGSFC